MQSRPSSIQTTLSAKKYKLGFSLVGLIACLLPMIPNVFWAFLPPVASTLPANDSALPFVAVTGTVCQSLMIALLILVINTRRQPTTSKKVLAAVGVVCLVSYLLFWVLYFTAPITPMLLLMMAILPSVYFICVGLCLENYPSLIPATLFALIHISITAASYL
jgi:hypothetical protein